MAATQRCSRRVLFRPARTIWAGSASSLTSAGPGLSTARSPGQPGSQPFPRSLPVPLLDPQPITATCPDRGGDTCRLSMIVGDRLDAMIAVGMLVRDRANAGRLEAR